MEDEAATVKINNIDWITNSKAGSRIIIESESSVKNQYSGHPPHSRARSANTDSDGFVGAFLQTYKQQKAPFLYKLSQRTGEKG